MKKTYPVMLAGLGVLLALPAVAPAQLLRLAASEDLAHYDVYVTVSDVANRIAVRIENADPVAVNCSVTIDSGPDTIVRRVRVDTDDVKTVSYGIRRVSTRIVSVITRCRGVDSDEEDDEEDDS